MRDASARFWRKRSLRLALVALALLPFGPGCSDDESGGPAGVAIDSQLTPVVILLGQTAQVACPVVGSDGKLEPEPTTVSTTPTTPASTQSGITPTVAATYAVVCATADGRLTDGTPAKLVVLGEGDLDRLEIETTLDKSAADLGEKVGVTCKAYLDKAPLEGAVLEVESTPSQGITVDGFTVAGLVDGDFDIACRIVGSDFTDTSPATLVVGKGGARPSKITASVAKGTIAAGESTEVTCTVYDQDGGVMSVETFLEAEEGLTVNGKLVQGTLSGDHKVTCKTGDASAAIETVPATVTVTPAAPATFDAWAEPAKPVYKPKDVITIKWAAKDGYGNIVSDAAATVTAPQVGVQSEGASKYTLLEDGNYTFTVKLDGDANLSDTVPVLVDGHGPLIIITSPDRGQTLTGPAADTNVTVTGEVTDEWGGVATLEVNGAPVQFDETGKFKLVVKSDQGLNLVVARATDTHGNAGKASVAWYFSTAFATADAATPDDAWLDGAVRVWLSQALLDDYDHLEQNCDAAGGNCAPRIDDLATLLEIMLTNVDFGALLGKPVLFQQNFPGLVDIDLGVAKLKGGIRIWADVSEISFGTATLNLDSRTGGINIKAKLVPDAQGPALKIGLSVHIAFDLMATGDFTIPFTPITLPFSAGLDPSPEAISTAELTIDQIGIDSSFDVNAAGGTLNVLPQAIGLDVPAGAAHLSPLADVKVNLGNLAVSFAGFGLFSIPLGTIDLTQLVSGIDQVFASLADVILDAVLQIVSADILDPLISFAGGELLKNFLSQLEINQTLDIPELVAGQPPASVTIGAKISDVQFSEAGGRIGLTGRAVAEKKVVVNPLGSILRDGCLQTQANDYALPQSGPMELALGLDLVNEILYGLWYNGGLNLALDGDALGSFLGGAKLDDATIRLEPTLPPILSDCNAKGTIQLQLGDAWIEANLPLGDLLINFKGWLSIELDAILSVVDGKLAITIGGISAFDLTVLEAGGAFADNPSAIEDLIKNLLNTALTQLLGDALSGIEIPSIALDGLLEGVPAGTALTLDVTSLKKTKGFLQLEGGLK
jgi:hypothetical protein